MTQDSSLRIGIRIQKEIVQPIYHIGAERQLCKDGKYILTHSIEDKVCRQYLSELIFFYARMSNTTITCHAD